MKKIIITTLSIIAFLVTSQCISYAGGPLVVKGGMAISYGDRPLLYRYDKGTLGMFSNSEAIAIIEDLFSDWEAVQTSSINFKQDTPGSLDFDVTADNFDPILNSSDLLGYTPVIFDNDGSLLDAFLGSGAGGSVLGLAGPITVSGGPFVNQIAESQAIFNGRFVNGNSSDGESSTDSFKGTIIHEFGHGIGLDHSQINVEAIKPGATQEIRNSVPLEFPVAVNDLFVIRTDDASAVSFLYPKDTQLSNFGKIEGAVLRQDGITPVQGANVIARNINNPMLEAISCVSDFLNDGTGSFTLFAVPPGDYRIEIEPIDLSFTGGSGVGPFTQTKSDKSFQNPVSAGFYIGPNQPITTDINAALVVNVSAGQTIDSVNIIGSTIASSSTSSSGSPTDTPEVEPNDTVSNAQVIAPPVTISGSASISDSGEIELTSDTGAAVIISDLFKLTLPTSGNLTAKLSIDSGSLDNDLDLVLFNSDASNIIDSSSQTGNVQELISKSLMAGTYLIGVGAFNGSSSYELEITVELSGDTPILSLSAPEAVLIKQNGNTKVKVKAESTNFSSKVMCNVFVSSDSGIVPKVKPSKFSLSSTTSKKKFRLVLPFSNGQDITNAGSSENFTVNVTCDNGANDEIDVLFTPFIENVLESRSYNRIVRTQD